MKKIKVKVEIILAIPENLNEDEILNYIQKNQDNRIIVDVKKVIK